MDNALSKRPTMIPGRDLGQQLKVSYSIEEGEYSKSGEKTDGRKE